MSYLLLLSLIAAPASPDASPERLADRVRLLAAGLTAADPQQRAQAERQILSLGPDAVEPLLSMLKTAGSAQAEAIDRLLPRFDPQAIEKMLIVGNRLSSYGDRTAEEAAVEAVARMGKPAIPSLRKIVETPYAFLAIGALRRMGPTATEELISLLRHPQCKLRSSAALVLAGSTDARSTEAFLEALRGGDECVQADSARALAARGEHRAAEPLLDLLKSPHPTVRGAAAGALGKLYEPRFLFPLIELVRGDAEVTVRNTAANALISQRADPIAPRPLRRSRELTRVCSPE